MTHPPLPLHKAKQFSACSSDMKILITIKDSGLKKLCVIKTGLFFLSLAISTPWEYSHSCLCSYTIHKPLIIHHHLNKLHSNTCDWVCLLLSKASD